MLVAVWAENERGVELLLDNGADPTVGRLLEAAAHRNDEKGLLPLHKRGIRGSQVLA